MRTIALSEAALALLLFHVERGELSVDDSILRGGDRPAAAEVHDAGLHRLLRLHQLVFLEKVGEDPSLINVQRNLQNRAPAF